MADIFISYASEDREVAARLAGALEGRAEAGMHHPSIQVLHHLGYEIEPVDRWDVELLRARFDVVIPESLCSPV